MTAKELIDRFRTEFFNRLSRKTGWGREELRLEFEGAALDTVASHIHLPSIPFDDTDDIPF